MTSAHQTSLKIASYNVRKARGLDQRRNPRRIVEVVNGLNADVVALQEADLRLGHRPAAISPQLIEEHTDFRIVPVADNSVSLGWHGNAVLLHRSLASHSVSRIELPGLEPRGAVRVGIVDGPTVVAVHLGLMRSHRRQQLKVIAKSLSETPMSVIAGDFNEWHSDRGLEPLVRSHRVVSPGRSFHAAAPVISLDRFAHSKNMVVVDAGVETSALARRASDHLPVWVKLAVPAQQSLNC